MLGKLIGLGKALGKTLIGGLFRRRKKLKLPSIIPVSDILLGGGALIGGLLGREKPKVSFEAFTPPHVQTGANILSDLLKQTPDLSRRITELKAPYIEKAIKSVEEMPTQISKLYDDLLAQSENVLRTELSKQAGRLGVLGLLSTQALGYTTADILDRTKLDVMRDKTSTLAKIYLARPEQYSILSELILGKDAGLTEFSMKSDIAKALMGIPTVVQPIVRQDRLSSILPALSNIILNLILRRRK